jgi:hypothetical protein
MAEQDKSLYKRLQKLFSTNVVVRNIGGKKLKVVDSDMIQSYASNAMRDRFLKVRSASSYGQTGLYQQNVTAIYQAQRLMFFRDYDLMDQDPILGSALDIYAEESTVRNEFGNILTVHTDDSNIKEILENLFYDILNIEYNLPWWIRNMVKYGDMFLFLEISPEFGIHNVLPLSVYDTFRYEGMNPKNPYEVYFETMGVGGEKKKLENYEVAHFRNLTDGNFLPYGKSALEPARRVWRQLTLMEDAMLIHRIMRAPEKRVFKIDVGNIPPSEVDAFIERIMQRSKKVPFIDERTGNYNLNYNIQNLLEDFYIPVRGGDSGTSIENLTGLEYNPIEDIEYLRNKMMAALRIPKAFLGYEEGISGKTTLAAEDVRFARTIERIQRVVVSELTKIAVVHLYAQGFTDKSLVNFSLELSSPSTIYELERINIWREKLNLSSDALAGKLLSADWVYENVFKMSEDEIKIEKDRVIEDVKRTYRIMQIEQGQSDPAKYGYPQDKQPVDPLASMGNLIGTDNAAPPEVTQEAEGERGRPPKGITYNSDRHPRGRDVLGSRENRNSMNPEFESPSAWIKSPLALETLNVLDQKLKKKTNAQVLTEESKKSYLDESNLEETE